MKNITSLLISLLISITYFATDSGTPNSSLVKARELQKKAEEFSYQNQLDSTLKYAKQTISIASKNNLDTVLGDVYNNIAIAYFLSGQYDSVVTYGQKCLDVRLLINDSIAIGSAYSKLGMGHQEIGNLKLATKYYGLASDLFLRNGEEIKAAQVKNNMANILERNNQLEEAYQNAAKASEILLNKKDTSLYVVAKANSADILRKQGKINEARDMLLSLVPLAHTSQHPDFEGQLYQSIGLCYLSDSNDLKVIYYYEKALEIYSKHNTTQGLSLIHGNLGRVYLDRNDLEKASTHLNDALFYANKSGSYVDKRLAYNGLSRLYKAKGDYKNALFYHELLKDANDSIYAIEQQKELLQLQKQFEVEEKNRLIAEQETSIIKEQLASKKKSFFLLISILGILGMIVLVFSIFKNAKDNREKLVREADLKSKEEKLRISRDLHDHIGAELTLIKSKIDQKAYLSKNEDEKKELEEISDYSKGAIDQLRKTIWATKSENISLDSFVNNLEQYANRFDVKINIKSNHSDYELSSTKALNLFRVCQESISNSVKYSTGDNIDIKINEKETDIVIIIKDNGKGFDIDKVQKGYGLSNMSERMKEINGLFNIVSTKEGTETTLTLLKK